MKVNAPPLFQTLVIFHQVDVDQSGSLNLREFILCMRKVREVELKAVKILGLFLMAHPYHEILLKSPSDQVMGFEVAESEG